MPIDPDQLDAQMGQAQSGGMSPDAIFSPQESAQTSLGSDQQQRLQARFRGTSPEHRASLAGHEPDIDYSSGAPFHVQTDIETADNPAEAKNILSQYYGNDIGQDKSGRWWFKDPKSGKKTSVAPTFLAGAAASSPETIGAIGGGALGAPLGPLGIVGGAALGGIVGKGVTEAEKYFRGVSEKTPWEEAKTLGTEGAIQGGLSAIPAVGKPLGKAAADFVRSKGLGVTPVSSARGGMLLEKGAVPPVTSIAPEASGLGKKQDIAARVSYGGKFGSYQQNIDYVETELRKSMASAGISPPEIEDFMRNVATKQEAVSLAPSGRSLVEAAQARTNSMRSTIEGDLSTARGALDTAQENVRRRAAQAPPELAQQAAEGITAERETFSRVMGDAYNTVHAMTEGKRVVDMRPAIQEAQDIVAEMSASPAAVPAAIRRLAEGERAVPVGEAVEGAERPFERQEYESIGAAHNLRSTLRQEMRKKSLTLTPEQQFSMISRVEDALNHSFTELAAGRGERVTQLASDAATELRRVDRLYREGIRRFKNTAVQKIVNDARDGIFADPPVVARTIFQQGQTAQAREIMNMLPPAAQEGARNAYLGDIVTRVSEVDPFTGRNILNGGKLLSYLNDDNNREMLNTVLGLHQVRDLRNLASEYMALNGNLEVGALQPSAIRDQLTRANIQQRALDDFVKNDPIGNLASTDPHVVDTAVKSISKPGAEAVTERAASMLNVYSPEWRRVQQDNLRLMFSDLFKKGESGSKLINGKPIRDRMQGYTARQRELLFPNGMGDDILELSENINFLFPQSLVAGGTRMQSGLIAGKIQSRSYFDPRAIIPRYYFGIWDYVLRRPSVLRFIADQSRQSPSKAYTKAVLGASGRMIINSINAGPTRQQYVQPQNPGGNPVPGQQSMSDEQPDPVRPGAQYAMEDTRKIVPEGMGRGGSGGGRSAPTLPKDLSVEVKPHRANFMQEGEGTSRKMSIKDTNGQVVMEATLNKYGNDYQLNHIVNESRWKSAGGNMQRYRNLGEAAYLEAAKAAKAEGKKLFIGASGELSPHARAIHESLYEKGLVSAPNEYGVREVFAP